MILNSAIPRRGGAAPTTSAFLGLGAVMVLGLIVTHPLVGTCDPCPPPPAPEPAPEPVVELFVGNESEPVPEPLIPVLLVSEACPPEAPESPEPPTVVQARKDELQAINRRIATIEQRLVDTRDRLTHTKLLAEQGKASDEDVARLADRLATLRSQAETSVDAMRVLEAQLARRGDLAAASALRSLLASRKAEAESARLAHDLAARGDYMQAERLYQRALAGQRANASRAAAQNAMDAERLALQRAHERQRLTVESREHSDAARQLLSMVVAKAGRLDDSDLATIHEFLQRGARSRPSLRLDPPAPRPAPRPDPAMPPTPDEPRRLADPEMRNTQDENAQSLQNMRMMYDELKAMRQEMMILREEIKRERDELRSLRRGGQRPPGGGDR